MLTAIAAMMIASAVQPHARWTQVPDLGWVKRSWFIIGDVHAGLSNDGDFVFGLNYRKSLSVMDLGTGKPIWEENVLLCKKKTGGIVALTDSQFFHVKNQLDLSVPGVGGGHGKTLCAFGDGYLEFLFSKDAHFKDALAIVYPTKRGMDSNRILTFTPGAYSTFVSLDISSDVVPIVGQLSTKHERWNIKRYLIDPNARRIRSTQRIALQLDKSVSSWGMEDINWGRTQCLVAGPTQTYWVEYDWRRHGKTEIRYPPTESRTRPYCYGRYIGDAILAWYGVSDSTRAGAFIKRNRKNPWMKVGEFELVALSQNRKKAIVRTADRKLWLIPTSSLLQ